MLIYVSTNVESCKRKMLKIPRDTPGASSWTQARSPSRGERQGRDGRQRVRAVASSSDQDGGQHRGGRTQAAAAQEGAGRGF